MKFEKESPAFRHGENVKEELFACPRRMNELGPWNRESVGEDRWNQRGPDRVCSFCGSMHPEDFEKILDRVMVDEECTLDHSDKQYKVYIHRPEIKNGVDGAVKFYKQHSFTDPEVLERNQVKFTKALKVSQERWDKRFTEMRANVKQQATTQQGTE